MTRHPCADRSRRSREVFEEIAIGNSDGHHQSTIDGLLRNGLIHRSGSKFVGIGRVKVPIYEVPTPIHIQWCQWCAEQRGKDDGR